MDKKIYKGQIIKNYKEFCVLMNEKETTGNGKINQLKRWGEIYTWSRKGHSYFISEIKIKEIKTFDLEKLFLSYIYMNKLDDEPFFISSLEIIRELELVNPVFFEFIYKQHDTKYNVIDTNRVINNLYIYLMNIVERTLLSLNNQSVIIYSKTAVCEGQEMELPDQEIWMLVKNIIRKKNMFNDSEMFSKQGLNLTEQLWNTYNPDVGLPKDTNKIILVDNPFNIYYIDKFRLDMEKIKLRKTLIENLISHFEHDEECLLFIKKLL